jgi:hypothetical protein
MSLQILKKELDLLEEAFQKAKSSCPWTRDDLDLKNLSHAKVII